MGNAGYGGSSRAYRRIFGMPTGPLFVRKAKKIGGRGSAVRRLYADREAGGAESGGFTEIEGPEEYDAAGFSVTHRAAGS